VDGVVHHHSHHPPSSTISLLFPTLSDFNDPYPRRRPCIHQLDQNPSQPYRAGHSWHRPQLHDRCVHHRFALAKDSAVCGAKAQVLNAAWKFIWPHDVLLDKIESRRKEYGNDEMARNPLRSVQLRLSKSLSTQAGRQLHALSDSIHIDVDDPTD